ncbi:efflux RND transporter periplasmic adaptor subunit [Seohaeicola saemankumensis]|nr:efflux RND transporter periplasmic adaptor subunit [Seohaeicola saemankumensis]MCA0869320.1 efflux RND transporter periplasmic adaptor subunit [Seohaeicola saemankumensis]
MKQVLFAFWLGCLTATPAPAENQAEFPGRIEALRQADVANAVASIVTEIHFAPGQFVRQGDPLFTLDATDFQLQLDTERANVLRAEATLKSAAADFERLSQLKERGSATGVQVLKAEVARAFADAVRAETQAALKAAETDLERTVIRAPISGVIGIPQVRVGSYVKIGRGPLANIIALDRVRLSYEIPYVQRVDELDIEDMRFPLSLLDRVVLNIRITDGWMYSEQTRPDNVSATVDSATGNMTIWAELANPMGQLRPGMRVTVLPQIKPAPTGD